MLLDYIAHVIYRHPDLDTLRGFLTDFGLQDAGIVGKTLYMKARDGSPFCYVAERGPAAFIGIGFRAVSAAALAQLAERFGGRSIASTRPGGGTVLQVNDPDGRRIEIVHGVKCVAGNAMVAEPIVWNDASGKRRRGAFQRVTRGPSHIQRLGHVALTTPDPHALCEWYRAQLGFEISDLLYAGSEDNAIGYFMHLGKGSEWTDHHTVAIAPGPAGGAHHSSYEVRDFDDLGMGHEWLRERGHTHDWGLGRHLLGSQVFDYWRDPCGMRLEHYTDGDLVNDSTPMGKVPLGPHAVHQWGPAMPADMAG